MSRGGVRFGASLVARHGGVCVAPPCTLALATRRAGAATAASGSATQQSAQRSQSQSAQPQVQQVQQVRRRGQQQQQQQKLDEHTLKMKALQDEVQGIYQLPMLRPEAPEYMVERLAVFPDNYVTRSLPSAHTKEDLGKYFEVDAAVDKALPKALEKIVETEFRRTKSRLMMLRQPSLHIRHSIDAVSESGDPVALAKVPRVIGVKGLRGCGKSFTLHYAAQAAVEREWLVLFLRADDVINDKYAMIERLPDNPASFTQNRLCQRELRILMREQGERLAAMPVQRPQTLAFLRSAPPTLPTGALEEEHQALGFSPEQIKEDGAQMEALLGPSDADATLEKPTLAHLVRHAITAYKPGFSAMRLLIDELKLPTSKPVLIAIDNFNAFDHVSAFYDPDKHLKRMAANRLALVQLLEQFALIAPGRGVSLVATSSVFTPKRELERLARTDRNFEALPYDPKQLATALDHYSLHGLLNEVVNERLRSRVQGLSGGTCGDVLQLATLL